MTPEGVARHMARNGIRAIMSQLLPRMVARLQQTGVARAGGNIGFSTSPGQAMIGALAYHAEPRIAIQV